MAKLVGYRELAFEQLDITSRPMWMCVREGNWTYPRTDAWEEATEAQEFAELVDSIETFGQIEPIGVRRKEGTDAFEVVSGWRRVAAVGLIRARTGTDRKIHALIWECTDAEARAMQLIPSLSVRRHDTPDTALTLRWLSEVRDPPISDQQLAKELGTAPAFAAMHLQVARCCTKEVLHRWKTDSYQLSLMGMREVAQAEPEKQTLRYEAMRDRELHHDESTDVYFEVKDRIDDIIDGIQAVKGGLGALVSAIAQREGGASDVTKTVERLNPRETFEYLAYAFLDWIAKMPSAALAEAADSIRVRAVQIKAKAQEQASELLREAEAHFTGNDKESDK